MKNTIEKRLHHTPDGYELMVLNIWFKWCAEKSKNNKSLQKVITCRPLFNWWRRELGKLEAEFMAETCPYKNVMDKSTARQMYAESILPIYDRFSRPLLKKAIKND